MLNRVPADVLDDLHSPTALTALLEGQGIGPLIARETSENHQRQRPLPAYP